MKRVTLDREQVIRGLGIRTTNALEMDPSRGKIGPLAQRFDQSVVVNYKAGARVYGVYFDYESDVSGEFTVLVGADTVESASVDLQEVVIPPGRYLVFSGEGEVPRVVIETWSRIWDYFSSADSEYRRAYAVDFEYYRSATEVDIHVSIE